MFLIRRLECQAIWPGVNDNFKSASTTLSSTSCSTPTGDKTRRSGIPAVVRRDSILSTKNFSFK